MKIKHIPTGEIGSSSKYNTHALNEIIVYITDDCDNIPWTDTDYPSNYMVFIESVGEWMTFNDAFHDKHIITDNYNTYFFEPENEEDRKRGHTI